MTLNESLYSLFPKAIDATFFFLVICVKACELTSQIDTGLFYFC